MREEGSKVSECLTAFGCWLSPWVWAEVAVLDWKSGNEALSLVLEFPVQCTRLARPVCALCEGHGGGRISCL